MSRAVTDYDAFEVSSVPNRRLLRQEELILEITEALSEALEKEGITKTELAERLGKTKGFVSQILAGGRNLTLRTIADVADALNCHLSIHCEKGRQKDSHSMISLEDYRRKSWMLPERHVIKVVPRGKTGLAPEPFESLLGTAA
jgi:transcriptional regulator with XRE-family HTH domain